MRLYVEGRLKTTQAQDGDLKNALARLKDGTASDLELVDGERKLLLKHRDGILFLDVADGPRGRYGMLLDAPRAQKSLRLFLKGELAMPAPILPVSGPGASSVVIGDAVHPACPLCNLTPAGSAY